MSRRYFDIPFHASTAAGGDALDVGDRTAISSRRRRGLAVGEQRVADRPIRIESTHASKSRQNC